MKLFEEPAIELLKFTTEDVLSTTSSFDDSNDGEWDS